MGQRRYRDMGHIDVDVSRLPLLVIRFQGQVDDEAFGVYIEQITQNLLRGRRYVMLFDASTAGIIGAPLRRRQADFIKQHQAALKRCCVGCAFVISQAPIRGLLTAIFWIQTLPFEHIVVGTVAQAERWCEERMAVSAQD